MGGSSGKFGVKVHVPAWLGLLHLFEEAAAMGFLSG